MSLTQANRKKTQRVYSIKINFGQLLIGVAYCSRSQYTDIFAEHVIFFSVVAYSKKKRTLRIFVADLVLNLCTLIYKIFHNWFHLFHGY